MYINYLLRLIVFAELSIILSGCAAPNLISRDGWQDNHSYNLPGYQGQPAYSDAFNSSPYTSQVPNNWNTNGEKTIVVNPQTLTWGAYDANSNLVRSGIATAGADFCPDVQRACRTSVGSFRIYAMGDETCASKSFPVGEGGALMPFCMFFNGGQTLHGSPDQLMQIRSNISHGCVHLRIPDAEWLRYHFINRGTKVIILPYT